MTTPRADRRDPVLKAMAANALRFAVAERYTEAGQALGRINERFGGDGAVQAALLWVDTLIAGLGATKNDPVAVAFRNVETGSVHFADGTPPTVVWAGRLIGARLADDEDTFLALINAVGQRAEFGEYIGELLHMVALTSRYGADALTYRGKASGPTDVG